jgi:cysteine/O-acetylserine efflux protein
MSLDIPAALVFVIVTTFTPGPNNILSASIAAIHGYRRTVPFMLGVVSGFLVVLVLCATVSTLLTKVVPAAAPVMRLIGGLYILWLAFGILRHSDKLQTGQQSTPPLRFWNGAVLQLVNPKTIFFSLTVFSVFLAPILHIRTALIWSPIVLSAICYAALSTWALGGHLIRHWIRTPRRARILGVVLAAALVWTAIDLAGVHLW